MPICGSHAEVRARTRTFWAGHQCAHAFLCASKRGIASKRWGRDLRPCEHRARSQNAATLPRPPSVFAGGRSKTLLQHLDAAGTITPQQRSTTAASPQRSQAARHAAGSLTSAGDSAASASTIEKIWPSKTTTPAAASPDPCLGATNGRKIACEVLFTLLAVFGRATRFLDDLRGHEKTVTATRSDRTITEGKAKNGQGPC